MAINKKHGLYLCKPYMNGKGRKGRPYNFDGKRIAVAHEKANGKWWIEFLNGNPNVVDLDSMDACDKYLKKMYRFTEEEVSKKKSATKTVDEQEAVTRAKAKNPRKAEVAEAEAKRLGAVLDTELKSKPTIDTIAKPRKPKSKKAERNELLADLATMIANQNNMILSVIERIAELN